MTDLEQKSIPFLRFKMRFFFVRSSCEMFLFFIHFALSEFVLRNSAGRRIALCLAEKSIIFVLVLILVRENITGATRQGERTAGLRGE